MASGSAWRICGTTCSGVTKLMLWQPRRCNASIIAASRCGVTGSPRLPGDVEVLAEHAPQVTAGEKDRARAVVPAQAILLTEMREMRGDDGLTADRAQPALICQPVHLA